ncbi:MAG: flagellar hook-basal body complex protein FliE [Actinomycetota bacterium]
MAFPIPPISPSTISPAANRPSAAKLAEQAAGPAAEGTDGGGGFTQAVGDALSNLNRLENAVEEASIKAATGDLDSVSDYMIAATEAQLATEITVAIRDRAITAFNDIMRMQI